MRRVPGTQSRMLGPQTGVASVVLSTRGAEFPVPGWYERDTGTFFYNIFDETFDTRQGDWLRDPPLLVRGETPVVVRGAAETAVAAGAEGDR